MGPRRFAQKGDATLSPCVGIWSESRVLGVASPFLGAGMLAACSVVLAWGLAKSFAERRRYHEEWGRLPIEIPS